MGYSQAGTPGVLAICADIACVLRKPVAQPAAPRGRSVRDHRSTVDQNAFPSPAPTVLEGRPATPLPTREHRKKPRCSPARLRTARTYVAPRQIPRSAHDESDQKHSSTGDQSMRESVDRKCACGVAFSRTMPAGPEDKRNWPKLP